MYVSCRLCPVCRSQTTITRVHHGFTGIASRVWIVWESVHAQNTSIMHCARGKVCFPSSSSLVVFCSCSMPVDSVWSFASTSTSNEPQRLFQRLVSVFVFFASLLNEWPCCHCQHHRSRLKADGVSSRWQEAHTETTDKKQRIHFLTTFLRCNFTSHFSTNARWWWWISKTWFLRPIACEVYETYGLVCCRCWTQKASGPVAGEGSWSGV